MIPTATVVYSTTGAINGSVTVTLTGASESITVTNNSGSLTKVFAANGSFIFEFSDVTGNTGSTMATVSNIDTTAPALSSISVTPDVSGTGANYTFDVNETATGTIYVGTGTSVLSTLVVSGSTAKTGSATHTGVLAGLTAGADYYYYIKATDAAGNITNSATGTFSSADTASPNVFNKRVDGITSTNGTVKFDFIDANYTVGTGPKTGTGHVTIGTGTSLNNIGTGYLAVATGSVNTASSAFASLVADTVYNYAISVTDNFGNPSSASTGSFVTASAPIDLTVSSTNTGITTLTGATVASGSGLALSGVITVVSDSNDSNSLTGSLVLS